MELLLGLAAPEHCKTKIYRLDDESFFDDTFDIRPLPVPGGGNEVKCVAPVDSSVGGSSSDASRLEIALNASKYTSPHLGVYVRAAPDSDSSQYLLCPLLISKPSASFSSKEAASLVSIVHGRITHREWMRTQTGV
jgi:hypothetical protein